MAGWWTRCGAAATRSGLGSKGLQVAERYASPIHLLLTDRVMPHMTGRELTGQVRPLRPKMKVLFMSGYAADVISKPEIADSRRGAHRKPFSLDSRLGKVREALNHSGFGPRANARGTNDRSYADI